MKYKLLSVQQAIEYCIKIIKKNEIVVGYKPYASEKGTGGATLITSKHNYFIKFMKKPYRSFQYIENTELIKAEGISMPAKQLYGLVSDNFTVLIVLPNEKIYKVKAQDWLSWSINHHDDKYKTIWKNKDRKTPTDHHTYYTIPIDMLEVVI